jgi:hypothetical protein
MSNIGMICRDLCSTDDLFRDFISCHLMHVHLGTRHSRTYSYTASWQHVWRVLQNSSDSWNGRFCTKFHYVENKSHLFTSLALPRRWCPVICRFLAPQVLPRQKTRRQWIPCRRGEPGAMANADGARDIIRLRHALQGNW